MGLYGCMWSSGKSTLSLCLRSGCEKGLSCFQGLFFHSPMGALRANPERFLSTGGPVTAARCNEGQNIRNHCEEVEKAKSKVHRIILQQPTQHRSY
jgi:hypothetical protein